MKQRTLEEKQELVRKIEQMHTNGQTYMKASKEFNIPASDFFRYRKQVRKVNTDDPLVRDIKRVNNGTEKMLRVENTRLRTLVVDLSLDVQALKEYHSR